MRSNDKASDREAAVEISVLAEVVGIGALLKAGIPRPLSRAPDREAVPRCAAARGCSPRRRWCPPACAAPGGTAYLSTRRGYPRRAGWPLRPRSMPQPPAEALEHVPQVSRRPAHEASVL